MLAGLKKFVLLGAAAGTGLTHGHDLAPTSEILEQIARSHFLDPRQS